MTDNADGPRSTRGTIVLVAICIVSFGVFMAIRNEYEQLWVRAAIASLAFAVFGLALSQAKKFWPRRK
jgi:nitrate/nitrite transporter NarK